MAVIKDVLKNVNGDDVTMFIEVDDKQLPSPTRGGDSPSAPGRSLLPRAAQDTFSQAMDLIETCATQVSSTVKGIPQEARPKEFEIAFSVKIDAEFGAILAKGSGEAQLQVTLIWGELIS